MAVGQEIVGIPAGPVPGSGPSGMLGGMIHIYVAFDLGEGIDLGHVKRLLPAEFHHLRRQPRTPSSIGYQPPPLSMRLGELTLSLAELGTVTVPVEAILFDFAALSAALRIPFQATAAALSRMANALADAEPIILSAERVAKSLYETIRPAIQSPTWSELKEEYFVFQIFPGPEIPKADELIRNHSSWLAGLVCLDPTAFDDHEIQEAIRLRLSYTVQDLVLLDWAAAVIVDRDCDETLETIAFANLQLLEFRLIDDRLDVQLQDAYQMTGRLMRSWLPFWKSHARPLRSLGRLKVEANNMMERTSNALQLIGDQYVARVYSLLVRRFHLEEWGQTVRRSLDVLQGIYQVVADQAATLRAELLEWIIILLILIEVVMSLLKIGQTG